MSVHLLTKKMNNETRENICSYCKIAIRRSYNINVFATFEGPLFTFGTLQPVQSQMITNSGKQVARFHAWGGTVNIGSNI